MQSKSAMSDGDRIVPLYAQAMLEIPFETARNGGRLEQARAALENLPEQRK